MRRSNRELQRRFWLEVRGGELREEAAVRVGLDGYTGRRWFAQAGGVIPAFVGIFGSAPPSTRTRINGASPFLAAI